MDEDSNPEWSDYHAVTRLYREWNPRARSTTDPLSSEERVGYLVVDYWIRLHMGAYDGLIYDDQMETVAALKTVNLEVQARALEQALSKPAESHREQALSAIADSLPDSFEVLLNSAVATYLRGLGQGHKLTANA